MAQIPKDLLELLQRDHPRDLLLLLGRSGEQGMRYADARRALALSPPQFQRALNLLEDRALVQLRVRRLRDPSLGAADREVTLQLSALGRALLEWWEVASDTLVQTFGRHHLLADFEAAFCDEKDVSEDA